jgi:hypothetical protein
MNPEIARTGTVIIEHEGGVNVTSATRFAEGPHPSLANLLSHMS